MQTTLLEAELLLMQLVAEQAQQQPADETEAVRRWYAEHAPPAVLDYIMTIDAEIALLGKITSTDDWLAEHHPALENALQGLHDAYFGPIVRNGPKWSELVRVQGEVLKYAYWRLGYAYARDRQPRTGGVWYDAPVQELAAQALLGWSVSDAHAAWLEPTRFVDQWRSYDACHRTDRDTLERAGLHAAELELLAATD